MFSDSDEHLQIQQTARPWRRLTVASGALLAACFFLPAVKSCNSDVIPARDLAGVVSEAARQPLSSEAMLGLATYIAMLLPAYVVGLVLAMAGLARLAAGHAWNLRLSAGLVLVLVLTAVDCLCVFLIHVVHRGSFDPDWEWWVPCFAAPLITFAYLPLAWRPQERRRACSTFLASWWMVCWFGCWIFCSESTGIRYGMHLSFDSACLLLTATIGEARAVTRQTWLRTIGQLLIGRLARPWDARHRCPQCDYLLYGLTEMRCPECGRPFTRQEVPSPPEASLPANP